jgi:hypothetical protein
MSDILRTVVAVSATALARGKPPADSSHTDRQPLPRATTAGATSRGSATDPSVQATLPDLVDPKAVAALDRMGAYLRTLGVFQVSSHTTRDESLDDGQRQQIGAHVDMLVQRPNRLHAALTSDRQQRSFFYDGTTFTLWARRRNYYATVSAPATLEALGDRIESRYGALPAADLFAGDDDRHVSARLIAAAAVGPEVVGDISCEHFAFREANLDWQIWIEQGDCPLPHKIVVTTSSDPEQPQYTSVMTWNLAPPVSDAVFTFEPTADARRITLADVSPSRDHEGVTQRASAVEQLSHV